MKKNILLAILFFITFCFTFCSNKFELKNQVNDYQHILKKDTITVLNLSNKKIKIFPDLSKYYITELDLSKNYIEKINETFLPKGLKILKLNENKLKGIIKFEKTKTLENLDVSNNKIERFYTRSGLNFYFVKFF